ncbi:nitrite reductase small subunit NirD [Vibrio mangrovi]|uniref:Nitrite reductase (NADH) small subunit n=1 Tax=Vibrio mangrovi TaxID=474394 RepID=A0A1Y6IN20_9VIBR|nr:nitrite reductase small subunit NirD [Vibrio mangrovi]MDW6004165.1 nitrite reductase small subunit NirD [Vibrio mangrovi]SMR99038.1 Nitrite reductase (NADH) small subunit [Vibrio mangrovi]
MSSETIHHFAATGHFENICQIEDITPGTGVCALVGGEQVAVFRPDASEQVFAIHNMDPFARSNVLSRGLICEHQGEYWVASPLKKQRFQLKTGLCMEDERFSIRTFAARVTNGYVEVSSGEKE